METSEQTIKDLYQIGNKEVKERLEKEYPNLFKQKTYLQQAIAYLGEDDQEVVKLRKLQTLEGVESSVAEQTLVVIIRWKNKKESPDWNNRNQQKWIPWFYMDEFRLSSSYYYYYVSFAPSRLWFLNKADLEELIQSEEIMSYYKTYMTN